MTCYIIIIIDMHYNNNYDYKIKIISNIIQVFQNLQYRNTIKCNLYKYNFKNMNIIDFIERLNNSNYIKFMMVLMQPYVIMVLRGLSFCLGGCFWKLSIKNEVLAFYCFYSLSQFLVMTAWILGVGVSCSPYRITMLKEI